MKKKSLTTKIFIALALGLVFGLLLYPFTDNTFVSDVVLGFFIELGGNIFINAIKMLVVPLVFVSLVAGTMHIGDIKKLGRIGTRTLSFYLITTTIAITLAITVASFFKIGVGFDVANAAVKETTIVSFFNEANTLVLKMVKLVMYLAPIGVFSLVAKTFATLGYEQ